jgi:hypothetical protein
MEWIRYALDHFWHLENENKDVRMVRGYNAKKIFDEEVKALPKVRVRVRVMIPVFYFNLNPNTNPIPDSNPNPHPTKGSQKKA